MIDKEELNNMMSFVAAVCMLSFGFGVITTVFIVAFFKGL